MNQKLTYSLLIAILVVQIGELFALNSLLERQPRIEQDVIKTSSPEALRQSKSIVDQALSAGVLTQRDERTLRTYLLQLNPEDQKAVIERIISAVNAQKLKLEGLS